jgi:hypothetical protein
MKTGFIKLFSLKSSVNNLVVTRQIPLGLQHKRYALIASINFKWSVKESSLSLGFNKMASQ